MPLPRASYEVGKDRILYQTPRRTWWLHCNKCGWSEEVFSVRDTEEGVERAKALASAHKCIKRR